MPWHHLKLVFSFYAFLALSLYGLETVQARQAYHADSLPAPPKLMVHLSHQEWAVGSWDLEVFPTKTWTFHAFPTFLLGLSSLRTADLLRSEWTLPQFSRPPPL